MKAVKVCPVCGGKKTIREKPTVYFCYTCKKTGVVVNARFMEIANEIEQMTDD